MKNIIKKNWLATVFIVLISIYESSSYLFNLDFVPTWTKAVVGIIAFIGFVVKNAKAQK